MGHVAGGAQHVADTVACADADSGGAGADRQPHAELEVEPRRHVVGLRLVCRQGAGQELQGLGCGAQHEGMSLLRTQALDRVVNRLQPGRQHEVHRRRESCGRIQHDDPRHDQPVAEAFLDAFARIGDAGEGIELGSRQRGRYGDHADSIGRRPDRLRRRRGSFLRFTGAIGVQVVDRLHVLPERDQDRLGGIDHRTATDRHDQIGTGLARHLSTLDDARPRRVRGNASVGTGVQLAEIVDHRRQQRALRHRLRGGDEHLLRAQPLGLGAQRNARWPAIDDALDVLMSVDAVQHGFAPSILILRRRGSAVSKDG